MSAGARAASRRRASSRRALWLAFLLATLGVGACGRYGPPVREPPVPEVTEPSEAEDDRSERTER